MKLYLTLAALFLLALTGLSQTGTISGIVTEQSNGATVPGAIITIDTLKKGAASDFDGKFSFRVPPGVYTITCRYTGFAPLTITGVTVVAGKNTPLDFPLSVTLEDEVIIYDNRPTTMAPLLDSVKNGNGAVDVIDKVEMGKGTATNAGEQVRRIPGVTLVDGRFVVVRGLSERYNAVLLNNVLAPSVESDVKAFSFDLIPSGMIDNFMVYKTPSPDLPGEFSGGAIRINTTDIPDQNGIHVNYQAGYRSGTTFNEFRLNKGTSSDLFGFGAGSRALPGGFPSNVTGLSNNPAALQALGREMRNDWGYETFDAPVDTRFNMSWNYRYSRPDSMHEGKVVRRGYQFGNITGVNYSNTYSSFMSYRLDYNTFDVGTQESDTIFAYEDQVNRQSVRLAFIQNNALRFGKGGSQRITFKNLFNQMGDNETAFRGGKNLEEGNYYDAYSYRYTQRTIYTGQLGGQHAFNNKRTQFDWTAAYSLSRRSDPDWRRARYTKDFSAGADDPYSLYISSSATPFFLGRIYMNVNEDITAGTANFRQVITLGSDSAMKKKGYTFTVKAGLYIENKTRTFSVRNIGYRAASIATYSNYDLIHTPISAVFDTANINNTNGLQLGENTNQSDQYLASNALRAFYGMAVFPFGSFEGKHDMEKHERVRISAGARIEHNVQKLNSNMKSGDTVIVNNDITSVLPSVNVAFNLTDRMVGRLAYGKTINRPEFREIAPFYFYDFVFNSINTGNDSLKNATVDNYDLRWEFYPRPGENITVGLFYKRFTNPIEVYFVPGVGSGGTRSFTWGNAPLAQSYGVEIEMRKKLDSIDVPVVRNLGIVANAAWIYSAIDLDSIGTTRPMMGQSPWIVNAGLFYQSPADDSLGLQVNLVYNVIGPRVVIVGVPGIPEVYEMPRHQLDLSIVKTFGKYRNIDVRLNITDLLNQETLLMQDANADGTLDRATDQRMQYFKRGTYYTFGVTFRLFEPKDI